jgi:hypothetical protein
VGAGFATDIFPDSEYVKAFADVTWVRITASAGLFILSSCRAPSDADVHVSLVDSIPWESESSETGTLRRVLISRGSQNDTVAGVTTSIQPVLGANAIHGFIETEGMLQSAFRYDLQTDRLTKIDLPSDINRFHSAPTFSPDGSHIAYVLVPGDNTVAAVVKTWPEQRLMYRSIPLTTPGRDVLMNVTSWKSPNEFEILLDFENDRWQRIRGNVRNNSVRVDTITAN